MNPIIIKVKLRKREDGKGLVPFELSTFISGSHAAAYIVNTYVS